MYVCNNCGYQTKKWIGKCPECNKWNTLEEKENFQLSNTSSKKSKIIKEQKIYTKKELQSIKDIESNDKEDRLFLKNLTETNKIFGNGIMKNSLTLLSGEPGIGKSTLLLQIINDLSKQNLKCCYISAEENANQIKQRYNRLGLDGNFNIDISENLLEIFENTKNFDFLIIDSIQRIYIEGIGEIGGTAQIKNCTVELMKYAKQYNKTIILVGQVTKDNEIAGPKILEHMVDTVLFFENFDEQGIYRYIRCNKNRFGSPGETVIFEMLENGLKEIKNPSLLFVNISNNNIGSSLSIILENKKSIFVEIQSLVIKSPSEKPYIQGLGIDNKRILQISAVIQKFLEIPLYINNIFINIKHGLKLKETHIDLAIIASILSSYYNKSISNYIFIGEIGLTGEIIPAKNEKKLLKEIKNILPNIDIISFNTGYKHIKDISSIFL